jgi:hypothetical protein
VWPYYTLYDLSVALREGNSAALENRVEWESVRQGLRGDLNAMILQKISADTKAGNSSAGAGFAAILGPAIINQLVEGYVTPQAVANLIRTGKPSAVIDAKPASKEASEKPHDLNLRQLKYAFFAGSPLTFKVEIAPSDDINLQNPLTLFFKWSGDWKLTRVTLPADAINAIPNFARP